MDKSNSYLEVLLAEYRAIKDEQKSRTALQVQLTGFVFVAASIAAALLEPAISKAGNAILLLALSIGFSLIGFLYLSISRFIQAPIQYEYEVLVPRIQEYVGPFHSVSDPRLDGVLLWWPWYRTELKREGVLAKVVKASTLYTPFVFSLGLVIFFVYFQGRNLLQMSLTEAVFLIAAVLMIAIYLLAMIDAIRAYRYPEMPSKRLLP